jgi:hypothetical protein
VLEPALGSGRAVMGVSSLRCRGGESVDHAVVIGNTAARFPSNLMHVIGDTAARSPSRLLEC